MNKIKNLNNLTREELIEALSNAQQALWEVNSYLELSIRERERLQAQLFNQSSVPWYKKVAHKVRDMLRKIRNK